MQEYCECSLLLGLQWWNLKHDTCSSTTTATNSSSPVLVDLAGVGSHYATTSNLEFGGISAGEYTTCGFNAELTESMCWGGNQLGNSSSSVNGTRVTMGSSGDAHTSISVGSGHACGIVAQEAYCWGDNAHGQLGLGTSTPASSVIPWVLMNPMVGPPLRSKPAKVAKAPAVCLRIQAPLVSIVGVMVHKVH